MSMFEGYADIAYTHAPQKDESELFEDIGNWPYDVIVFYNLTQQISDQRRANFLALTDRGVGILARASQPGIVQSLAGVQADHRRKILHVRPEGG